MASGSESRADRAGRPAIEDDIGRRLRARREERNVSLRELARRLGISPSAISQFAALAALEEAGDWLSAKRTAMLARRDAVIGRLAEAGMPVIMPDAWPHLLIDTRLIHPDDQQAAVMLREQAGVQAEPASSHGQSLAGYTRITLAAGEETLDDGLDRLIHFHETCR